MQPYQLKMASADFYAYPASSKHCFPVFFFQKRLKNPLYRFIDYDNSIPSDEKFSRKKEAMLVHAGLGPYSKSACIQAKEQSST